MLNVAVNPHPCSVMWSWHQMPALVLEFSWLASVYFSVGGCICSSNSPVDSPVDGVEVDVGVEVDETGLD